jgi:hypothetical protein
MIILTLIVLTWIFFKCARILKNKHDTICIYTGTNGSGKTFFAVKDVLRCYRKLEFKRKIKNAFKSRKKKAPETRIYSNIPIASKGKVISYQLTYEHMLMRSRIPENSIVFVDEISTWLSQLAYDNKNIDTCDEFATFFRHYVKGYFIATTQDISKVNFVYRYCAGSTYCLEGFTKFLCFCWTNVTKVTLCADVTQVQTSEDETHRFYGIIPFRKNYDTHCFSVRYNSVPQRSDKRHIGYKVYTLTQCPRTRVQSLTSDQAPTETA